MSHSKAKHRKADTPTDKQKANQKAEDATWALVRTIPAGRVMTYGQIADYLAEQDLATLTARQVGRLMATSPDGLPWQRVVNASGRCSVDTPENPRQQRLLEAEGVVFTRGRLPLRRLRWWPDDHDEL